MSVSKGNRMLMGLSSSATAKNDADMAETRSQWVRLSDSLTLRY
jgi:hypothetical protein